MFHPVSMLLSGKATQSSFLWAPPRVQWLNSHDKLHCFSLWVDKGRAGLQNGWSVCVQVCVWGEDGGISESHGDIKLYCMPTTDAPTISNVPPDVLPLTFFYFLAASLSYHSNSFTKSLLPKNHLKIMQWIRERISHETLKDACKPSCISHATNSESHEAKSSTFVLLSPYLCSLT